MVKSFSERKTYGYLFTTNVDCPFSVSISPLTYVRLRYHEVSTTIELRHDILTITAPQEAATVGHGEWVVR